MHDSKIMPSLMATSPTCSACKVVLHLLHASTAFPWPSAAEHCAGRTQQQCPHAGPALPHCQSWVQAGAALPSKPILPSTVTAERLIKQGKHCCFL